MREVAGTLTQTRAASAMVADYTLKVYMNCRSELLLTPQRSGCDICCSPGNPERIGQSKDHILRGCFGLKRCFRVDKTLAVPSDLKLLLS